MSWRRSFRGVVPALIIFSFIFTACAHKADTSYMMRMSGEARDRGAEAFASGDRAQALERYMEALRIDRSMENSAGELADLVNLGRVYNSLGRFSEAAGFLSEAVSLGIEARELALLSDAYAGLAMSEHLAGYTGTALDNIEEAIQIDARAGLRSGSKLNLRGVILIAAGRFSEAGVAINEALEMNSTAGLTVETADSYRALGDLFNAKGEPAEALRHYEMAYRSGHSSVDPLKVATDLAKMAELNLALGHRTKAAMLFERSYVVSFNTGQRDNAAGVLDRVIGVYTDLGNSGKASFYRKVKDGFNSL